jgi:hypothetical protein
MPFMTTAELLLHRTCHIGNLNLLKQRYSDLRPADKARADWTMANLMKQVYAIDEELQMAGTA